MSKYYSIRLTTREVQATLEGRMMMTRRIVKIKGQDLDSYFPDEEISLDRMQEGYKDGIRPVFTIDGDYDTAFSVKCPYGKVGDILWVRETFSSMPEPDSFGSYLYKANDDEPYGKWKSYLFMPKEACRLFLKITSIKVERLQDISEEDAIAEGVLSIPAKSFGKEFRAYVDYLASGSYYDKAVFSFESLWQSINGEESWNANPFVWIITFEKIQKPADFLHNID